MKPQAFPALAAAVCLVLCPALAYGQAARTGQTFAIGGTPFVVTPDVAYDSVHDRYLVVHGHGFIEALLTNAAGTTLASAVVNASRNAWAGEYAQTPRVAFGPDVNGGAGGYLVTWHETVGSIAQVRGRLMSADGAPLGGDILIATDAVAPGLGSFWTQGAAVAYSPASREFLVAWMGHYTSTNDIYYNRVSAAGVILQAAPTRITAGSADWERDASVAYNPDLDEFYIAYAGFWDARGYSYVSGARVQAGTGAFLASSPEFIATAATLIPAVTYNRGTRLYTVGWYNKTRTGAAMYGINVNADGSPSGAVRVLSGYYQAYDALDIKYNPNSGDMLLTTHGNSPQAWEDACVSIRSDGTPYDNGFFCTNTTDVRALKTDPAQNDGNYNPRLAVNTSNAQWLLVTSSIFLSVNGQFITSSGAGGGPPPPPPPPTPQTVMSIDTPGASATVSTTGFLVGGWALERAATSSSGIDAVHVYAWPVAGGGPIFLGVASLGTQPRPDVAAIFGAQFVGSSFNLMAGGLAPGAYNIGVYARSVLTGAFTPSLVPVTVKAPPSNPLMAVDLPGQGQNTSQNLTVGGWAVDLSSASTGVDAVHVYAFSDAAPTTPIFLGVATVGIARPDVGAALGSHRFDASGFELDTTIPPGSYTIAVYARSTVSGFFNNVRTVRIRVL